MSFKLPKVIFDMGYLENLKDYMIYCSRGHFVRQSGDPSSSWGKTVIIDQEAGECPECDQEVKEAQQLLGRLGIQKGESNGTT